MKRRKVTDWTLNGLTDVFFNSSVENKSTEDGKKSLTVSTVTQGTSLKNID